VALADYIDANGVAWHRIASFTGVTDYDLFVDAISSQTDGSGNRVVDDGFMVMEVGSMTETEYNAVGNVVSTTDQMGRVTKFKYDFWGRQIEVEQPDPDRADMQIPALTKFEYDLNGNLLTEKVRTDDSPATFLTTEHQYDRVNQRIKTIDSNGDATTYQFDAAGNMTALTEPELNTTTFAFDGLNRLTSETNELNKTRSFEYDANSNRTKSTDRNGKVIEHIFDNLGPETEERWKDALGATVRTMAYGYNPDGSMKTASDDGSRGPDYEWLYDEMGRVEEIRWSLFDLYGIYNYKLQDRYDAASQRTQQSLQVGEQ
jgi:YD repeat-containing protein